jgi:parallel beta-helix repeat protein
MNRKLIPIILILPLLATGTLASTFIMRAFAADYTDVTIAEAKTMIAQKPSLAILDVRNQSEYDSGHIRNARLIPVWQLATRLNELNKSDEILVYCKKGARSLTATLTLIDNGFMHVYHMLEGTDSWIAAGYPVYVKYSSIQEAINNATEGAIINLSSGLYSEHLTINKSLTLDGENKYTTVIDGTNNGTAINVEADNITIADLTIQDSGCSCADYAGVYVKNYHKNIIITNNRLINDGYGVKLIWAQNISMRQNEIANGSTGVEIIYSHNNTIIENNIVHNAYGINLMPSWNNIIRGNTLTDNSFHGIMFRPTSNQNTFSQNKITNSQFGVRLFSSSNNTLNGNTIKSSTIGIDLNNSTGNEFYQNTLINNDQHVQFFIFEPGLPDLWDGGSLLGGNYWSNYTGADANHDGIGDSPQVLDSTNRDNYPLMGMFTSLTSLAGNTLDVVSNSTLEGFQYFQSNSTIKMTAFNTTGGQTTGFCRATIPHDMLSPPYNVTVNNNLVNYNTIYENDTLSIIYFSYEVVVVPEFPSFLILPLFMMATLLALMTYRRKRPHGRPAGQTNPLS